LRVVVLLVAVLGVSCGAPKAYFVAAPGQAFPPHPHSHEVTYLGIIAPSRPYVVIGLVSGRASSMTTLWPEFYRLARLHGADAILRVQVAGAGSIDQRIRGHLPRSCTKHNLLDT
jgi:hypothetical protein